MRIFRLGVRHGYFYHAAIGTKEGRWRTHRYVMTRRLAPHFKLDPNGFAGCLFVTTELLDLALVNPKKAVAAFRNKRLVVFGATVVATGVVEVSSKISLEELRAKFPGDIDLFVCSASFEERCLSVARSVAAKTKDVVIVRNDSYVSTEERNYKALQSLFGGEGYDAAVSSLSPTATADALKSEVVSRIPPNGTVLVDITTFTHEHLLILMALIRRAPVGLGKVIFAYTGAEEYSTNTDEKDVWLSHGVTSVRSILGYPGNMVPSRKLHLIVLVGFESERARSVIEILEPARLSLGVGDEAQSVSVSHYRRNRRFLLSGKGLYCHSRKCSS